MDISESTHGQRWASGALFSLLVCGAIGTAAAQSDRSTSFEVVLWIAFRIDPRQSERLSAPDWARDVRVDIHATIPEGSRERVPEMLQTLLNERFGLRASVKPRLTDVYELIVSRGGIRVSEVQAVNELDKTCETEPSLGSAVTDRILEEIDGPVRVTITPRGMRTTTARSTYTRIYKVAECGNSMR